MAVLAGLGVLATTVPIATAKLPGSGAHARPQDVQIITEDLPRFWQAYDAARGQPTRQAVFEQLYLTPGSVGLREFMAARPSNFADVGETSGALAAYYDAVRPTTLALSSGALQARLLKCLQGIQRLDPSARFQDVTLALGSFQTGGTTGRHFLLIGAEFFSRTPGAPEQLLSPWARAALEPPEQLPFVITHELVHTLQRRTLPKMLMPQTLLRQALTKGIADFVTELGCAQPPQGAHYAYGLRHERAIWQAFQRDRSGPPLQTWLYQGDAAQGRPADLGYFVGYRVAQAYYARQDDKKAALRALLRLRDPASILRDSGYHP